MPVEARTEDHEVCRFCHDIPSFNPKEKQSGKSILSADSDTAAEDIIAFVSDIVVHLSMELRKVQKGPRHKVFEALKGIHGSDGE